MRPIKITADLAAPVVNPPMLDSTLERLAVRRRTGGIAMADDYVPGTEEIFVARQKIEGYEWPVPCCSSPIFTPLIHAAGHVSRRMDVNPLAVREDSRTVHHTNMGEYKSHRLPVHEQVVARVAWFAVGDADGVSDLLAGVRAIGKKTSIGYGVVLRWEVTDVDQDWSWFGPRELWGEILMRPLPASTDPAFAGRLAGVRGGKDWFGGLVPPYWDTRTLGDGVWPC